MAEFSHLELAGVPLPFHPIMAEISSSVVRTRKRKIQAFVISDIHADSYRNRDWVVENCRSSESDEDANTFKVMIVPGDVATDIDHLETIFKLLVANYDVVCYCVGNHECWRRGSAVKKLEAKVTPTLSDPSSMMASSSISKIVEILKCAKSNGVHVGPLQIIHEKEKEGEEGEAEGEGIGDKGKTVLAVVPLQSWYHSGFDKEPELTDAKLLAVQRALPFEKRWGDFVQCSWPGIVCDDEFASISMDSTTLSEAFASLNEFIFTDANLVAPLLPDSDCTVLSFSHFVPRQELVPEKRFLLEPMLAKVIGSDALEAQVRRLRPDLHMFGHTHIPIDLVLDGIRYIQWPLGYQREADKQCSLIFANGPLKVFDSSIGIGALAIPPDLESKQVHWSQHYMSSARDTANETLAPWLVEKLKSYEGFVVANKK